MMHEMVLVLLCTMAGLVVLQQMWGTRTTIAVLWEAVFVAGFVIRMLFLIVLMLAGAGLLSVVGEHILG